MNGISHSWNGTVLTITSDSGTSSCDLKGEKGDDGVRGAQGAAGNSVIVDKTLSLSGSAADAKVTGDKINALQPIGQLISGSTKPLTSGAGYTLQEQINSLQTVKDMSGYSTLLDYCIANPHSMAMYKGYGFSDCALGNSWGTIITLSPDSGSGVLVFAIRNNDTGVYMRKTHYYNSKKEWNGDWLNITELNTKINKINPNSGQLQSATDGTAGRVTMFTYGNGGYLDFDTNDAYSYRLVLGGNGLFIYKYENGTIIGSKEVAKF